MEAEDEARAGAGAKGKSAPEEEEEEEEEEDEAEAAAAAEAEAKAEAEAEVEDIRCVQGRASALYRHLTPGHCSKITYSKIQIEEKAKTVLSGNLQPHRRTPLPPDAAHSTRVNALALRQAPCRRPPRPPVAFPQYIKAARIRERFFCFGYKIPFERLHLLTLFSS